ncbi:hypothetical protein K449DRAFT_46760 [Hypoxylon sp. EC38]|nr:hypothetical protein K449DRAFT_46760 [Hypoxylon sp. EC38]
MLNRGMVCKPNKPQHKPPILVPSAPYSIPATTSTTPSATPIIPVTTDPSAPSPQRIPCRAVLRTTRRRRRPDRRARSQRPTDRERHSRDPGSRRRAAHSISRSIRDRLGSRRTPAPAGPPADPPVKAA